MVTSCEVAKVDLSTKQFEFNHQQVCLNPPELLFKSKKKHIFNPLTKSVVTNNLITRTKITCDSVAKLHVHRIKHCDFSGFYISISVCLSNHSNPYIFTIASFFETRKHGDTRNQATLGSADHTSNGFGHLAIAFPTDDRAVRCEKCGRKTSNVCDFFYFETCETKYNMYIIYIYMYSLLLLYNYFFVQIIVIQKPQRMPCGVDSC